MVHLVHETGDSAEQEKLNALEDGRMLLGDSVLMGDENKSGSAVRVTVAVCCNQTINFLRSGTVDVTSAAYMAASIHAAKFKTKFTLSM